MNKMNKKGFTLIELLVVIAIIGILSGIVLTSLGSAREKAKLASAKGSMTSMRSELELLTDSAGTYPSSLCSANSTVGDLPTTGSTPSQGAVNLASAVKNNTVGGAAPKCSTPAAATSRVASWAGWFDEDGSGSGTNLFCVDSAGYAGSIGTAPANADSTCL